jgi:hypothetical protein
MRIKLVLPVLAALTGLAIGGCTVQLSQPKYVAPQRVSSLEGKWAFTWIEHGNANAKPLVFRVTLSQVECHDQPFDREIGIWDSTGGKSLTVLCYTGSRFTDMNFPISPIVGNADLFIHVESLKEGAPVIMVFKGFTFTQYGSYHYNSTWYGNVKEGYLSGIWSQGEKGYENYLEGTWTARKEN